MLGRKADCAIELENRKIDSIVYAIDYVGAGTITNVSLCEDENAEFELYFEGEDGTDYRILLNKKYSFAALQNVDTGEWLITSEQ